jgi:hypothetical protein
MWVNLILWLSEFNELYRDEFKLYRDEFKALYSDEFKVLYSSILGQLDGGKHFYGCVQGVA